MKDMGCLLPTDSNFSPLSNNIDKTTLNQICNEFGVDYSSVGSIFRFRSPEEWKIVHIVNLVEDYHLGRSNGKDSYWKARKMGYNPNKVLAN